MPNVQVSISADITDLTAKLAVGRAELSSTTREMNRLAREVRDAGGAASNELRSGLTQAAEAVVRARSRVNEYNSELRSAGAQSGSVFGQMRDHAIKFSESLNFVLKGGGLLIFVEIARKVVNTLTDIFQSAVKAAVDFSSANAQLANQLGISTSRAAALRMSLSNIGSSGNEYADVVFKITRMLKTNEEGLNRLGVVTRDQNRNVLDGQQIMQNALGTMAQYKSGTDQNLFAVTVFGRGIGEVHRLMRLNEDQMRRNTELLREFGVATGSEAVRASSKLKDEMKETTSIFDTFWVAISQRVTPSVRFLSTVNDILKAGLSALLAVVDAAAKVFNLLGHAIALVAAAAQLAFSPISALVTLLKTRDLEAAAKSLSESFGKSLAGLVSEANDAADAVLRLFDATKEGAGDEGPLGKGTKTFPQNFGKENAEAEARLEAQRQFALAAVKAREEMNDRELASSQKTAAEHARIATGLSDERLNIERRFFSEKQKLESYDTVARIKTAGEAAKLELTSSNERLSIRQRLSDAERAAAISALEFERSMATARFNIQIGNFDALLSDHKLTIDERIDLEKDLTNSLFEENSKRLEAEKAYFGEGTTEWLKAERERLKLAEEHTREIQRLDKQMVDAAKDSWRAVVDPITRAFDEITTGVLRGTQTWKEAIDRALADLVISFIQSRAKIELAWLGDKAASAFGVTNIGGSVLGGIFEGGGKAAAGAAAGASGGADAAAQATQALTTAITGQTAATIQNTGGIFGWIGQTIANIAQMLGLTSATVADVATTTTQTTVTGGLIGALAALQIALDANTSALIYNSGTNLIPFDVGAWNIPRDTPALVHRGEMIIPAAQADLIRRASSVPSFAGLRDRVSGVTVPTIDLAGAAPSASAPIRTVAQQSQSDGGQGRGRQTIFAPRVSLSVTGTVSASQVSGLKKAVVDSLRDAHRDFNKKLRV